MLIPIYEKICLKILNLSYVSNSNLETIFRLYNYGIVIVYRRIVKYTPVCIP